MSENCQFANYILIELSEEICDWYEEEAKQLNSEKKLDLSIGEFLSFTLTMHMAEVLLKKKNQEKKS